MSVSIEQAAANLAAALESGSAGDAESALASYAEAIEGVEDVPEADNGPLKRSLADLEAEQAAEAAGDEELAEDDIAGAEGVEDEDAAASDASGVASDESAIGSDDKAAHLAAEQS